MAKPKDDADWLPAGLLTLLELCDVIAANRSLQSVCSDGNSSAHAVARDIALSVMDFVKAKSVTRA